MNNCMSKTNGAISIDGRFAKKIDDYARRNHGKTLVLSGLREIAREHLEAKYIHRCIISQVHSRIYFGMSMNPSPLEKQLYSYAFKSSFSLRVNQLTTRGREKGVDTMLTNDAILMLNDIEGFALCSGDRDFVQVFDTFVSNGIPCILFAADFERSHTSWELKARSSEVIDVLSLINDSRVFQPLLHSSSRRVSSKQQSNTMNNGLWQGNKSFHQTNSYTNFHGNRNQHRNFGVVSNPMTGSFTRLVIQAVKNVMAKNSNLNRVAKFAFQDEVNAEIERMGRNLNIPLYAFLCNKSEIFLIGTYRGRATVSIR